MRTLAERRADFEAQMRECAASDGTMALTELSEVSARIKELRGRTDLTQYDAAHKLRVPPRTTTHGRVKPQPTGWGFGATMGMFLTPN